ncbi:hypothetical protein AVEN_36878-1 [Araneus ventricosus]|uniref:Tc1-like transposase DDE domain-containing protein n=1 Tax=Araneus ventricosus TaxID=182803 RepID=A0A4Y2RBF7_ARAVE|nr:hypothetical protein AVEN_36878-1 [Araneus ventricosus]
MSVLNWPTPSPDFHPIENVWGILIPSVYQNVEQELNKQVFFAGVVKPENQHRSQKRNNKMSVQRPNPIVTNLELGIEEAFEYFSLKEGVENGRLPVQAIKKWFKEAGISGKAIYTVLSDSDILEAAVASMFEK